MTGCAPSRASAGSGPSSTTSWWSTRDVPCCSTRTCSPSLATRSTRQTCAPTCSDRASSPARPSPSSSSRKALSRSGSTCTSRDRTVPHVAWVRDDPELAGPDRGVVAPGPGRPLARGGRGGARRTRATRTSASTRCRARATSWSPSAAPCWPTAATPCCCSRRTCRPASTCRARTCGSTCSRRASSPATARTRARRASTGTCRRAPATRRCRASPGRTPSRSRRSARWPGRIAFYDELVDVQVDGEPRVRPVTIFSDRRHRPTSA